MVTAKFVKMFHDGIREPDREFPGTKDFPDEISAYKWITQTNRKADIDPDRYVFKIGDFRIVSKTSIY